MYTLLDLSLCKIPFDHDYCKMQKFCPLCVQNGVRSRIKAFQMNLEEAVWSCERIDCIWPFGYKEPIFFPRSAMACNWDDSYVNEESTSTLSELSLYTPPMTPGEEAPEYSANSTMEDKFSESISSTRESTDCNKSSFQLTNNKFTKEKDISKNANKQMPEIINIEKVNIDISKFLQYKHLDHERMQKDLYPTFVADTMVDSSTLFVDNECSDFSLHAQCKTGRDQSENANMQATEAVISLSANTNIDILSTTMNSNVHVNVTNNLNTINYSTLETTDANLESSLEILNSIFDNVSNISKEMEDDDWLDLIKI